MILMNKRCAGVAVLTASIFLSACGGSTPAEGDGVRVAAAFYPLQYAAEVVGGDLVAVDNLTTPGAEAHDLELSPRRIAELAEADLVIHLTGFQPAVDDAIAQSGPERVIDAAHLAMREPETDHEDEDHEDEEHAHGNADPHFWLDPTLMVALMDDISAELQEILPEDAEQIRANAEQGKAEMMQLDDEFSEGLGQCQLDDFFTTHAAFGYLAERYGLHEVALAGITPDDEPSPARIAEVQEQIEKTGATTIFFEAQTSDAVASTIADDLGLETAVLDPVQGVTDQSQGEDYPSIMRANLEALRSANGCA